MSYTHQVKTAQFIGNVADRCAKSRGQPMAVLKEPLKNPGLTNKAIQNKVQHTNPYILATTKNHVCFPLSSPNCICKSATPPRMWPVHRTSPLPPGETASASQFVNPARRPCYPCTGWNLHCKLKKQNARCDGHAILRLCSLETVLVHLTNKDSRSHEFVSSLLAIGFRKW